MRSQWIFVVEGVLLWAVLVPTAIAQRGMGDRVGVAQQAVKPEVVHFMGTVKSIVTEPCEMTTGRSTTGTHFVLTVNDEDELNVHLGPASSVEFAAAKLVVGQEVMVEVFRTEKMKQNHYVAQSLTVDGDTIRLRDENRRPEWAGEGRALRGSGQGRNAGTGGACGCGRGCGNGAGRQARGRPGGGRGRGAGRARVQPSVVADNTALSDAEAKGLIRMREEEKLAHDVYVALADKWNVPVFANISRAESRHTSAVARLIDTYALTDPVGENPAGKFSDPEFAKLYDELIEAGSVSLAKAYQVGALIEEMDIDDIRKVLADVRRPDVQVAYRNLERASRNHLRAFAARLDTLGETYATKHLSQTEFDSIATSAWETGRGVGRGGGGGLGRARGRQPGPGSDARFAQRPRQGRGGYGNGRGNGYSRGGRQRRGAGFNGN